ncbi:hypothetical protein D3C72_2378300 [compost metagenome]
MKQSIQLILLNDGKHRLAVFVLVGAPVETCIHRSQTPLDLLISQPTRYCLVDLNQLSFGEWDDLGDRETNPDRIDGIVTRQIHLVLPQPAAE